MGFLLSAHQESYNAKAIRSQRNTDFNYHIKEFFFIIKGNKMKKDTF